MTTTTTTTMTSYPFSFIDGDALMRDRVNNSLALDERIPVLLTIVTNALLLIQSNLVSLTLKRTNREMLIKIYFLNKT